MSLWLVRKKDTGFTLIEMLVVVIIVGVIGAIAAPSFLGLLNRNRVNSALNELEGAIKEAQRQAMRRGQQCTVDIDTTNRILSGNCLLSNRTLGDNINIRTSLITPSITFSHKGNTTNGGTIVISSTETTHQRCYVISNGIGISRTGNYTGTDTDPDNCDTPN